MGMHSASMQMGIKFVVKYPIHWRWGNTSSSPSHCLDPAQDCLLLPRDLPVVPRVKP